MDKVFFKRTAKHICRTAIGSMLVFGFFVEADSLVGQQAANSTNDSDHFFENEIRPLLINRCSECHNRVKSSGDLRVDSLQSLLDGGETGPAIVPRDAQSSLLVQAVRRTGDIEMPPEDELSEREILTLERWIEMGAPWPETSPEFPEPNEAAKKHRVIQADSQPTTPDNDVAQ